MNRTKNFNVVFATITDLLMDWIRADSSGLHKVQTWNKFMAYISSPHFNEILTAAQRYLFHEMHEERGLEIPEWILNIDTKPTEAQHKKATTSEIMLRILTFARYFSGGGSANDNYRTEFKFFLNKTTMNHYLKFVEISNKHNQPKGANHGG